MKTVFRGVALFSLLCSVPVVAEGPRDRHVDRKPLIVDGVQYERSEIKQFSDREEMYWVAAQDATYGFTTKEGVTAFGEERAKPQGRLKSAVGSLYIGNNCAGFNKNVGCGGIDWLPLCTPNSIPYIANSWNDVISCVETGPSIGKWTTLYKCYNYDPGPPEGGNCSHILWVAPGVLLDDLNDFNMNNIVSSIRFCSNVNAFSCT